MLEFEAVTHGKSPPKEYVISNYNSIKAFIIIKTVNIFVCVLKLFLKYSKHAFQP